MGIASGSRRFGSTRLGTWSIKHLVSPLDRWSLRIRGRPLTATGPICLLTTRGRRSGEPRTTPVFFLRDHDDVIVCNVNPGFERTNPWVVNLRTDPSADVQIGRLRRPYRAREASAAEVERFWPRLVAIWPAYESFFERGGRRAIFVLEPAAGSEWTTRAREWTGGRLLLAWAAATAAAETVGYACAAVLFALPAGPVLGGFIEGTLLGAAQAVVLRRAVEGFPGVAWWALTAAVATIGWGAASGFSGGGAGGAEPPALLIVAGAAGLGAGMGLLMGGAQWLVLRRRYARAWTWVVASAAGWGAGMIPAFWAATVPQAEPSLGERLALGAAGGLLMGLAVGVITGWRLCRMGARR